MHQVVCATTNPAKIQAILQTFRKKSSAKDGKYASVAVESGVPEQPFGSEETRWRGDAITVAPGPFLGGDMKLALMATALSWVVIENAGQRGEARSATCGYPAVILEKLREGEALGPVSRVIPVLMGGGEGGAIGVLFTGKLARASVYHQAVMAGAGPFHNAGV
ncbi:DUF84 family protein [Shigella flexneri]